MKQTDLQQQAVQAAAEGFWQDSMQTLESRYILSGEELTKARKVLTAAALTYVAALLNSILQLIRLLNISKRNNRR